MAARDGDQRPIRPLQSTLRRTRRRGRNRQENQGEPDMTQTSNGPAAQRKSLATEIDRLDGILDGLDEALAGSVETAVRDVVGQVVRETVEATVREVLSNPDLIRAAIAQHAPVATPMPQPPRKTLKGLLKEKLA